MQRMFLDVTYTRMQTRSVGITRTVARLAQELPAVAQSLGVSFACVAFDGRGFRLVDPPGGLAVSGPAPVLRGTTGTFKRSAEKVLGLPWWLVRPAWAALSGLAFRQAVKHRPAVAFAHGDVLLAFDAGWNYPVDRGMDQARRAGASIVTMVYDLMPLQAPQFCAPWVRGAFADWLARSLRLSDAILCISRDAMHHTRETGRGRGWRLPPMDHFRLGSDLDKVQDGAVRSSLREFLQAPRVYASVGSIEPKKNHAALLDAFEEAWAGGSDARLLVVGRRTPECATVIARMDRHVQQAPWRAMLVDDASDAELAYVYGNCRAVVLPSSFEGFGLPLVEARTRGCPVFANKLAAFRELADAGVEWFDSQRPSTLTRLLLEDAAGRLPLGREAMAPFGWQESARQCLARVDALLAAAGRAHGSPNPLPLRGCEP